MSQSLCILQRSIDSNTGNNTRQTYPTFFVGYKFKSLFLKAEIRPDSYRLYRYRGMVDAPCIHPPSCTVRGFFLVIFSVPVMANDSGKLYSKTEYII
ncbi:hypothetical protein H6F98_10545 [Microcoleus sp. FACHB-SPT15]|uniref:hypothetical protein n=1 Tax=Microcoleus sp. FACHB-SPT15 TaxID=2692830 RepID=UPI00178352F5|nr:hypothetical protein [Microcoleus sp. FACHB-SPT15]MBD1805887.1 hypothetical protein [Microcoleus sp. FACHB-SPT15]